jgi:group I intron endonuclease
MIGIYIVTSPSGKVYIGQSWNIKKRWFKYRSYACQQQPKLFNSFKKHGIQNHSYEVLHELPFDVDQATMDIYEELYINAFLETKHTLLNLKSAGSRGKHSDETKEKMKGRKGRKGNSGSFKKGGRAQRTAESYRKAGEKYRGFKHSESTKQKLREKNSGVKSSMYGRKLSELQKSKLLKANKERIISEHTRQKMSDAAKLRKPWLGKNRSEETKQKISNTKTGVKHTEQHRKNRSEAVKAWWAQRKLQKNIQL